MQSWGSACRTVKVCPQNVPAQKAHGNMGVSWRRDGSPPPSHEFSSQNLPLGARTNAGLELQAPAPHPSGDCGQTQPQPRVPPDAFASSTTEEAKRRRCRVTLCAVGCSPGQALPKPSSNTRGGGQGSTNRTQATAPRSVRWRIAGLNPCPPLFDTARSGQKNPFSFTGLRESAPGKEGWSHKSLFWPQIKASLGGTPRIPQF